LSPRHSGGSPLFVHYGFAGRCRRLLLIDGGNWLIVVPAVGTVIGGIGI
jgi:hypothetical protein